LKIYSKSVIPIEGDMGPLEMFRSSTGREPEISYTSDLKTTPASKFSEIEDEITTDFEQSGIRYNIAKVTRNVGNHLLLIHGNNFSISLALWEYSDYITMSITCDRSELEVPVIKKYHDYCLEQMASVDENHKSKIYIINKNEMGLSLRRYPIKAKKSEKYSFDDLYNDDFMDISQRIIESLSESPENKSNNGITLLHGDVGTGKTNFLRYLITRINKRVIYLPPDLSTEISSPVFLTFLMEYPDSILIIEDAENVLKTRDAGGNQAVSNILNMSDGILGDALSLQIVCTFNDDIINIDKALLREGRLVEIYKFGKLDEEKTKNLFSKVHGKDAVPPNYEMSLSQIFNTSDYVRKGQIVKENKVGFI